MEEMGGDVVVFPVIDILTTPSPKRLIGAGSNQLHCWICGRIPRYFFWRRWAFWW